jgi:hypothetical protein
MTPAKKRSLLKSYHRDKVRITKRVLKLKERAQVILHEAHGLQTTLDGINEEIAILMREY